MKFYTKKSKLIFCSGMTAAGVALIAGAIMFLAAGHIFKIEERFVSYDEIEQLVGESPDTSDYDRGYLDEEYKEDYADYKVIFDAEAEKQQAVLDENLSIIFRNKLILALAVALALALPTAILYYGSSIAVLEIEQEHICFSYVNGKKINMDIRQSGVVFSIVKVYSITYFFIPQYVHQFEYCVRPGIDKRKKLEVIHLGKADGRTVLRCLNIEERQGKRREADVQKVETY